MITFIALLIVFLTFVIFMVLGGALAGSVILVVCGDMFICGLIIWGIYELLTRKKKK